MAARANSSLVVRGVPGTKRALLLVDGMPANDLGHGSLAGLSLVPARIAGARRGRPRAVLEPLRRQRLLGRHQRHHPARRGRAGRRLLRQRRIGRLPPVRDVGARGIRSRRLLPHGGSPQGRQRLQPRHPHRAGRRRRRQPGVAGGPVAQRRLRGRADDGPPGLLRLRRVARDAAAAHLPLRDGPRPVVPVARRAPRSTKRDTAVNLGGILRYGGDRARCRRRSARATATRPSVSSRRTSPSPRRGRRPSSIRPDRRSSSR